MDFNTDVTNRPAYYNSFNSNNKVRPAQTPSGDYGCTPKTCVDTRVPLPDTLKGIFNPPKKRVALRVLSAVIAFVVLLGAVGTGILIEQRRSVTSSEGDSLPEDMEKYQMYDVLPSEVARYVTPASESVQLVVKDIERSGTKLTLNEIYEKCSQSVVGITAVSGENGSLGTGIVMDARGYILTNAHVVDDALLLYVTLNNERVYEAMLVGADSDMDVAVLKIDAPDLTAAEFGNSDQLMIGEDVAVIGDPTIYTELRGTLTNGIISALNRPMDMAVRLIQTNAAINTGNSGGPVINAYGQVVGITVMKMTSSQKNIEGLGFAIPVTSVKAVIEEIIRSGEYEHPAIGIIGMTVSAEFSATYSIPRGVLVDSVLDAALNGGCELLAGDVIIAVDGIAIEDMDALNDMKYRHTVGETMVATVLRGGNVIEVKSSLFSGDILSDE